MMSKILFLNLFMLITQIVFGQVQRLTEVAGTKCSLIVPTGFVAVKNFSGFQSTETGASIMINEMPAPYKTTVDALTVEAMKLKGVIIEDKQTIDYNGSKATLIRAKQLANSVVYTKYILIFEKKDGVVFVNGVYPESLKEMDSIIKDALLSTIYNNSQSENALDAATFSIDTQNTDFKLIQYLSGSLIYSIDEKLPTNKPIFIASNSLVKINIVNYKNFSEERLYKIAKGALVDIKGINELTIDNLKGIEIVANWKTKDDKIELVYQLILFNEKGDYYILFGNAKDNFDENLLVFKKMASSFKVK